jgi:DNA-binding CsgD family transcriptional regulator/tetratricopeptide (TPR) repeat protein
VLVGRRDECDVLDGLLVAARGGRSGVLVLRGEPGVGKTALVDYAVGSASGFRVARALGVESEMELAFAALHQLCAPMLGRMQHLPGPQRDALSAAFGLSAGTAPERFLVGLAGLSLLSETAHEQPLLCVVDDAQWLDGASAEALAFVARRVLADPIALLFATREQGVELDGLPELVVGGLEEEDARLLLGSAVDGPLDDRVRDRIVAETRGNPLALMELPRGLTPTQLAVGFRVPDPQPLSGRIEESFRRRVEDLPAASRRLLLIASADQLGDVGKIWRAAELLGVGPDAAVPASEAGLLDIGTQVRFRHPLVRSAVYRAAPAQERQAVHRALAEASDPEHDPDRRAWHLAEAASGPDEDVAAELERSAGRAQQRGGLGAAAAFLERSAELTPEPEGRAKRLLLAAEADLGAGAHERAQRLLRESVPHLYDPGARAQALGMEGAIRYAEGRGGDTPGLLLDAAMALREMDARLARETLMNAFHAAMWAGNLTSGTRMADVAEAARAVPAPEGQATTASLLLSGFTERLTTGYAPAVEWWRRALAAYPEELDGRSVPQWLGMAWVATGELFDFESHLAVARERSRLARDQGALVMLPVALSCQGWAEHLAGRVDVAEALEAEARAIAAAIGTPAMPGANEVMHLAMLTWRGLEEETRRLGEAVMADAVARGQGFGVSLAQFHLMTLELSLGRYEEARVCGLELFNADALYIGSINLVDLIEAAARCDDLGTAHAALERLSERALASGTPWGVGLLARGRALLAAGGDAEALYEEAPEQLERSGAVIDVARTRLLYGEWLRRRRRRRDARMQLRLAHDMFQATGGAAFAHRARVELLATGEHTRARASETLDELTPQEKQIAQLAAEGGSNAAIGAQLFISPHTVAYHLRKVFSKLGVSSRNQLAGAMDEPREPVGASP